MKAIYKRELKAYFTSVIGCLFIAATLFVIGIFCSVYNLFYGYPNVSYALSGSVFLFLISIPVLTMRILAEERKQKTDQLILTAPVSVGKIVIGKYLALATIFTIPIAVICIYPAVLSLFGTVPLAESYIAILGFYLYGLAGIAVCLFISSLTESQVIAAVISFAVLFIGYVMSSLCSMISQTGNLITKLLGVLDMVGRFDSMLNGTMHLDAVVYYLSVITLFLVLTVQSIQKRRYSISTKSFRMGAYSSTLIVIVTAVTVGINLIVGELPSNITMIDVTSNHLYSLTDETKNLVKDLKEDVTIYALVNEKYEDTTLGITLDRYNDLSEHITVSYVDPTINPKFYTTYSDSALTQNSLIVVSDKRSKVIDYNNIYESTMDYQTYTSTTTGYDGEGQITSALAYVTSDSMPKAYILEGHGELAFETDFNNAIEKENVDYETINLMNYETIPDDAQCIIINAPTSDFSTDDLAKVTEYLDKGKNAIIISTYTYKDMTNFRTLLGYYGVEVTEGLVIEADTNHYYQDPFYLLPGIEYDEITGSVYDSGAYIFAPYSQGLTVAEQENVAVTSLLTSSASSYARNDISQNTDYSKQEGDVDGPFTIGLKATKTLADGESTALIYSCENIFTSGADSMVSGANQQLFSGTLSSVVEHEATVSVPSKSYEVSYLTIPQRNIIMMALLIALVLPIVTLLFGLTIWLRRRKR